MSKYLRVAVRAALLAALMVGISAPQARAQLDCNVPGVLPFNNCTLQSDTIMMLSVDDSAVVTVSAGALAGPLIINHEINGNLPLPSPNQGTIVTAGNGGEIYQQADIGNLIVMQGLTINAGDTWFVSGGSNIFLGTAADITIDGGVFSVDPNSAASIIDADFLGGAGNDTIDYISGGQSIGVTGFLGLAGDTMNLGAGDDRFLYYQSAGSIIGFDSIQTGDGNDLLGILGASTGSIFSSSLFMSNGNDTLAFFSGSTATFGSVTGVVSLGAGNDVIDFDSGTGVAGGTIIANFLDLGADDDMILLTDNSRILMASGGQLTGGSGNDVISFTSGGFINADNALVSLGDGDDLIQFNDIAFASGVRGLTIANGTFDMGAGNDNITFLSGAVGLNVPGTVIGLGAGDDNITLVSATGTVSFVSGNGFTAVDGGTGDDRIEFGSAVINAFGAGADIIFGSTGGAASIVNVETIDIGNGTLQYTGSIDALATIVNFERLEFLDAGSNILAFISGGGNAESVTFSSGATLAGTAELGAGADSVNFFSGAVLSGTLDLGDAADTLTFGSGAQLTGTADGGAGADVVNFVSGLSIVSGQVVDFSSAIIQGGATLRIQGAGSIDAPITGTGTLQVGQTGSTADTINLVNSINEVGLEILGDTVDTNGTTPGSVTPLRGLTVSQGALFLINDDVDAGNGIADAQGILNIDGDVRIAPGVTLSGDQYSAVDAGRFIIEINYDGVTTTAGQLLLEEAGQGFDFNAAGDVFEIVFGPATQLPVAATLSFASAGAGGTVSVPVGANVVGSNILYTYALADTDGDAQDLELVIAQNNTIADLTNSDNNDVIANVLFGPLLNETDTGIVALRSALLNASGAQAFNDELEAASPIVHGGEIEGIQTITRRTFGLINQRLAMLRKDRAGNTGISTGDLSQELEAWWQFYGATGDHDERGGIKGYETTTYGIAAGVDKELFEDGFFGISFSWGETSINDKAPGDADSEVDSYMLSLYGDYDLGRAYINGMVSYGYNDIHTSKTSAAGTRTADYHANSYAAQAEIGYAFMPGKTRLIPFLMAAYGYHAPESYTEEGPAGQTIAVDSLRTLDVGGGVDFTWLIGNENGSYFVPELRLGYRYDLADETYVATSRFFAGGPAFEIKGADPAEQSFDLGLGMTYFSKNNWELLMNYDFEYKEDFMGHSGLVRASYKFHP